MDLQEFSDICEKNYNTKHYSKIPKHDIERELTDLFEKTII